jgi:hypothetical protein
MPVRERACRRRRARVHCRSLMFRWNSGAAEAFISAAITRLLENPHMIRHLLIGVAACAIAAMSTFSASAMPRVAAETLVAGSDSPVILARGGHGHGHMGRGGRGHHYGWSRGRHRGWR